MHRCISVRLSFFMAAILNWLIPQHATWTKIILHVPNMKLFHEFELTTYLGTPLSAFYVVLWTVKLHFSRLITDGLWYKLECIIPGCPQPSVVQCRIITIHFISLPPFLSLNLHSNYFIKVCLPLVAKWLRHWAQGVWGSIPAVLVMCKTLNKL